MLPGPAPKPTAIKIMEGNPGKQRLNDREPQPTVVKATPPRHLTDPAAKKLYATYAKELVRFGLLTRIDVDELAHACDLWAAATRLWETYKAEPIVTHPVRGREVNPAYRAALAGFESARKVFRQFGVGSPGERSRLKVVEPDKKKSKFSGLITNN